MLSFLPRRWLQNALFENWRRSLPRHERIRLDYWGTTGNAAHHPFAWADDLARPGKAANLVKTDPGS